MKIKWLGHSAFQLEESTGTKVVTDPYNESEVGYEMASVRADVVTLSHDHNGHNNLSKISGNPLVINKAGAFEVMGVHMSSIKSYHDDQEGLSRGENLIFKYRIDGVDICHLGDIGEPCSADLSEILGAVDILLLPVGGTYTIDAEQAKEYVDYLMPDIVIPMHFKTKDCELDIDKIDSFLKLFEEEQIVYLDTDTLSFDRADFEHEDTKVIVMEVF